MLPPIPKLSDYGISPTSGFLPTEIPLQRLPDAYYAPWESVVANLQALILSRRLREVVDRLPALGTHRFKTDAEWRRGYSLLIFMAHGYIWGGDQPSQRLPPPITIPLLEASAYLEVPPVATYAGLCLWNFRPIFPDEPIGSLENLSCLNTFTGSLDEQWFYLVSVAIEAQGASTLPLMLNAIKAARANNVAKVTSHLADFAESIDAIGSLLQRMYDHCDPHVFYNRIRPFLAGSKNMQEAGLPHGVFYDDGTEEGGGWRQYGGGSNAQSPIIQFFDIVLGIEHFPTGEKAANPNLSSDNEGDTATGPRPKHNFIQEMRTYMPGPYRRFLEHVASVSNIRSFVEEHRHDAELCIAYDACLAMLRALRDKHIKIVSRYIIVKSRESRSRSRSRSMSHQSPEALRGGPGLTPATTSIAPPSSRVTNIATIRQPPPASTPDSSTLKKLRGTGGTALIPFLKQARDETGEPAVGAWAKRMLRGAASLTDEELAELEKIGGPAETVGMGGSWSVEDGGGGGICLY